MDFPNQTVNWGVDAWQVVFPWNFARMGCDQGAVGLAPLCMGIK